MTDVATKVKPGARTKDTSSNTVCRFKFDGAGSRVEALKGGASAWQWELLKKLSADCKRY